jgi:hypothetical protein
MSTSTYQRRIDEGAAARGMSIVVLLKVVPTPWDELAHHTGFATVARRQLMFEK